MAEKHDMEIIITPDGQVKMEIKGMKGPACVPAIQKVAEKLGRVDTQNLKPEYYEKPATGTKDQTRL
jgi:hypothetical protein